MANLSLNLGVWVKHPKTGEENFARVKVPDTLPRFVTLPAELHQVKGTQTKGNAIHWAGVPLEQVIAHNLESLFPGMILQECHFFRITRDVDIDLAEDEADDLLLAIQQELRKRRFGGSVVRLEIQPSMSPSVRSMLMERMRLTEADVYEIDGLINLRDLISFLSLALPDLKDPPFSPVVAPRLRHLQPDVTPVTPEGGSFFSVLRRGDLLVHHPYESFSASVELFIQQAAVHPKASRLQHWWS